MSAKSSEPVAGDSFLVINVDPTIFGTGKFYKEQKEENKENIYSDIDDMLNHTLKSDNE